MLDLLTNGEFNDDNVGPLTRMGLFYNISLLGIILFEPIYIITSIHLSMILNIPVMDSLIYMVYIKSFEDNKDE